MMKKLCSLLLVVAMILSLSVSALATTYTAGDNNTIASSEGSDENALKVIYGSVDVEDGAMKGTNAVLEMDTPVAFEANKHWAIEFKLSDIKSNAQLILAEKGLESGSVNGIYLPASGDLSIIQSSTWYFTQENKVPSDYNGKDEHTYRLENDGTAISYFLDGKNLGTYSKHSGGGVAGRDTEHGYTDGAPALGGFTYGFIGMMRGDNNAIWTLNSSLKDLSIYTDSSVIAFAGEGTLPENITTITPEGGDARQIYPTDELVLPAPSAAPEGKVFAGWKDASGNLYKTGDTYTVTATGTTTLTATYVDAALTGTLMVQFNSGSNTFSARLINDNNAGDLKYQWMRDGAEIEGATGETYTMTDADAGHKISCQAENALQSGTLTSQKMTVTAAKDGTVQGSNIVMALEEAISTPADKNWAIEFKLSGVTKTQAILSDMANEHDASGIRALYLYSTGDLAIIRDNIWYFTPEYTKPEGFDAEAEHTYRIENKEGTVSYYLDGTRIGAFTKHPGAGVPSRTNLVDGKPALGVTYKYLGIERKYSEQYPGLIDAYKFSGNLLSLQSYDNSSTIAFDANYEGAEAIESVDSFGTDAAQRQLYVGDKITLPAAPVREGYDFAGWSDGTNLYDAGAQYTVTASGTTTLTAQWGSFVAQVGTQGYETLEEAITAAKAGNTVKLLADTKENVTIAKKLTLDLNGHTLNGGTEKGKPALTVTASVTVKDSSEAQTGTIMREDTAENSGTTSHYVIDIQGNGWLIFESGNVKNNSGIVGVKGASLVRVGDDSVAKYPGLNIKGGTFTQDNFIAIKVDRGDLFLNGGTINSANSYAIENWHRTTINTGTVNGVVAAWTYSGGANSTIGIKGGTINGNVNAVNYGNAEGRKASITITGGTITGELDTRSYDPQTNELTSIDDAAKAAIEVSGGTFTKDPSAYLAEGVELNTNDNGSYTAEKTYLAKIGETSYYTMAEAFSAVKAGETITMLRDYTTNKEQNSGSKSFTIDLDGHTWTYTGKDTDSAAFEINYSDVTLTVKNGTVVSNSMVGLIPSAMSGTIKYDNSGLVFENVIMTANGHSGIESNGNNTNDTITLKNSTLNVPNGYGIYFPSSGTVTLENSKINAKTMGVQVCAGSLTVKNSEITVTGGPVEKTENDGAIEDGAAISIVDRTGYKGLSKVTIESGKFTAKSGNDAVKAYKWENKTESDFENNSGDAKIVTISGGTFSAAPNETLLADDLEAKLIGGVYQVQEKNTNAYEVVLVPDTQNVSAGDTITYTVKLVNKKDTASEIGFFRITPPVNDDLLELTGGKATKDGVKYAKVADNTNYEFTYAGSKTALTLKAGEELTIGTLTYKVKAYETDQTQVTVTMGPGSKDDQVSNPAYNEAVTPEVKADDVVYHVIKVTFEQDDRTTTDFYAPYGGSDLYESLEDLAAREDPKSAPTLDINSTGDTKYRLRDDKWHLKGNLDTLYDAATTKLTADTTYVTNRVNLVEIEIPEHITVPSTNDQVVTKRDGKTYVDEKNNLTFTVGKDSKAGEKFDVIVKVDGNDVPTEWTKDENGTITGKVDGKYITGKVTFEVKSVLDLDENDIYIFTTNEDSDAKAYLQYSAYSGTDTLVLIQGKTGANYTLNADEPVIYATEAYKDIDADKTYTHAVLVPKQDTVSEQAMLDYLISVGLKVTDQDNEKINIASWDTNGNNNEKRDLGDVQAANDFKTLGTLKWTPSDKLLLLADVMTIPESNKETADKYDEESYTAKRDGHVSDDDVNAFVYRYAKLG